MKGGGVEKMVCRGGTERVGMEKNTMKDDFARWGYDWEERVSYPGLWGQDGEMDHGRWRVRGVDFHIRVTENNTHVTASWYDGLGVARQRKLSAGVLGYKGSKRGTSEATQSVVRAMRDKLEARGEKSLHVYLNGSGSGRGSVTSALYRGGVEVLSRSDTTREPHGGCRGKKMRRI